MVLEKSIIRLIASRLLYLVGIAIFISIFANVYVFFSHSETVSKEKQEKATYSTSYHVPKVIWNQPKTSIGRYLEEYDSGKISDAYQNAWYFLNEALRKKSSTGLEDFFSDQLIKEIELLIDSDNEYVEDRVDLNHNLDMHLYSVDKQIVAFKDNDVRIKRKVLKNKKLFYEEELYKNYEVIMTLTDGKWRVHHMKEVENNTIVPNYISKNEPHFVFDSLVTFVNSSQSLPSTELLVACKINSKKGYHKIKPGETIYRLSKKYNVTIDQIMKWNKLAGTSDIKVCSHLRVQNPDVKRKKIVLVTPRVNIGYKVKTRIVKNGESIYTISNDLSIEPRELRKANGIKDNNILPGQILQVPNQKNINTSKIEEIKGINYYPQSSPWLDFWVDYDPKVIRKDLMTIKGLGMNTIRIFIPSDGVVPGLQFKVMLDKLELLLDECTVLDLDVVVTLFDFPVSFDLSYYPRSERQLEDILTRFKDHSALVAWDIKNEPDLDFERHTKKKVLQWLTYMIEKAKVYDPNHLLTIGWSNPEDAVLLASELDFVSYHYYRDPKSLALDALELKSKVNKPILLGEFGLPSNKKWYLPMGHTQIDQRDYLIDMKTEMDANGLSYLLWTLHDFDDIPTEVFGYRKFIHSKQKYFGLIDKKGNKKPAYYIFAPNERR